MRKLVSLGLFALFLSILSSPLSADVSACDDLTADENAPKGLYGLCIAYYNSVNGKGRDRIAELYEKKAIAAKYEPLEIPGTGTVVDTVLLDCPCWLTDDLIDAVIDDSGIEKNCGTFTDLWWGDSDRFELGSGYDVTVTFEAGDDYCIYGNANTLDWEYAQVGINDVTQEDIDACHQQIREITKEAEVSCSFK